MAITAQQFNEIKARIKAEMARRNGFGDISAYAGTEYDFTTVPVTGGEIKTEQGQKVIDLALVITDINGLASVQQGDIRPTETATINPNLLLLTKMNDRSGFVGNSETDWTKPFRWYNGSAANHTFTDIGNGVYQDTVALNQAANLGPAFVRLASDINLDSNSYYTLSCWAKYPTNWSGKHLDIGLSYYNTSNEWVWRGGTNPQNFESENWQHFSLTFKPDADTQAICYCFTVVGTASGTDTFIIKNCKLEKSDKVTKWVPAPSEEETSNTYSIIENALDTFEVERLTGSSSCRGACTGLCVSSCVSGCSNGCQGCSGCGSNCTSSCSAACKTGCSGCSGCGNTCDSKCNGCSGCSSCSGACRGCSGGCTSCTGCNGCDGCTTNCRSSCNNGCGNATKYQSRPTGCTRTSCMGGCTATCMCGCLLICSAGCQHRCQSCSGGCTGCSTCTGCGGCSGCSGCGANCASGCHGCSTNCGSACSNKCGSSCSGDCGTGCGTGCSSACSTSCLTTCTSSCTGTCDSQCFGTCTGTTTAVAYGRQS